LIKIGNVVDVLLRRNVCFVIIAVCLYAVSFLS
jgi:hypothetical protein